MGSFRFLLNLAIIAIVYFIIFYALKIMYKDTKSVGRNKKRIRRATSGLEVIEAGSNNNLRPGGVVPISGELTIGRSNDNIVVLEDKYVSSHHLRIFIRNNEYILEDLGSTNGTFLNNEKVINRVTLTTEDRIKVGSAVFKFM